MKKIESKCQKCNNTFFRSEDAYTIDWYCKCLKCKSWNCSPTGKVIYNK